MARTSSRISSWVFRMLEMECGSLTETGIVSACTPAANANWAYRRFGTSTETCTAGMPNAWRTTSPQSAIWGKSAVGNERTDLNVV